MALGMTADEFWHGKPRLAIAYREADEIKRTKQYFDEWRSGVYVYEALLAASPAYREISKGIDHEYPNKPLFTTLSPEEVEEEKQKEQMEKNRAAFTAMANKFNHAFGNEQSEEGVEED